MAKEEEEEGDFGIGGRGESAHLYRLVTWRERENVANISERERGGGNS